MGTSRRKGEWAWYSAAEDAVVRAEYPRRDVLLADLARRLGRSVCSVERRAKVLGVARGRYWTAAEDLVLRAGYADGTAPAIAHQLGRTVKAVHKRANSLGLSAGRQPTAELVAELVAAGQSDGEIARALGRDKRQVSTCRRRRGLEPNRKFSPEAHAARVAAGKMAMAKVRALGLLSIRQLRDPEAYKRRRADLARQYGLPEDLFAVQTRVVVELARGPATARRLAEALGRTKPERGYYAFGQSKCPSGNYLTDLRNRGLVAVWRGGKGEGNGRGQAEAVYFATATALRLMRAAATSARARA